MADKEKRTIKVVTSVSVKVNVGNFETLEVMKSIDADVEFSSHEELCTKSSNLDKLAASLLRSAVEQQCEDLGRNRKFKLGGREIPVSLWVDGRDEAVDKTS
jgi:hypothetical protein